MKTILRLLLPGIFIIFLLSSCWEFLSVDQPDLADPNSSFDVPITISLTPEGKGGTGKFGILLPIGWTAEDSISYNGVHSGTFLYSSAASAEMDSFRSAPAGYYWWVCEGDTVDSLRGGTVSLTPRIITDDQTGTFFIDYMLTARFQGGHPLGNYVRLSGYYPISVGAPMTATITSTNDNGPGSLRQALADISNTGEILFNLSYPDSIVLDSQLVIDRNITITGPDSGELTISGNNTTRVFRIQRKLRCVNISSLNISNGNTSNDSLSEGGGIFCGSPKYRGQGKKSFTNNPVSDFAGHRFVSSTSTLSLTNVTIINNSAEFGGGIFCGSSDLNLINVTISNNSASGLGGGIFCEDSELRLTNVTVSNNFATSDGGGIYLQLGSTVSFINTISWYNLPQEIYFSDGYDSNYTMITHSDVQGGLQGIVTNSNGIVYWLDGNIDTDPMFVDTANGDYRLQAGSPCIDTGTAFFEFGGDTLINLNPWQYNGSAPDMGAYEFGPPLGITEEQNFPKVYTLKQNYPNPFNPITNIEFSLPKTEFVELKVYNLLGKKVATLVSNKLNSGSHTYHFNGENLASGVYYYQLVAGDFGEVKKMVLIK